MAGNAAFQTKTLAAPDETFPLGASARAEIVHLGDITAARVTFQPGWRWSEQVKPHAGTDLCQVRHVGYVIAGRAMVRLQDGTECEIGPGDVFDVPPGHDSWVVGDEPHVSIDFSLEPPQAAAEDYPLPEHHKVLLDNDRVRVLDVRIPPGQTSGMHGHPPNVVYALSSAKVRMSFKDGSSREVDIKEGDIVWSEGGWHQVENLGPGDDWGIIVELKK